MKAEIIMLTPSKAMELLERNVGNRKMKSNAKDFYVTQMRKGLWKENGEPIIIDENGFIKDGQHRLMAVIEAGFSYKVPVITGVNPNVMDTIDTGTNRSLGDVLDLNGFQNANTVAGIIKVIINYNKANSTSVGVSSSRSISNSVGLEFALSHKEELKQLCKTANRIRSSQKIILLTPSEIGVYLYAISKFEFNSEANAFIKGLCSNSLGEASCTNYGHRKLLDAKLNKVSLSSIYKFNLMAKLWEIFQNDVPVNRVHVKIDKLNKIK